MTITPVCIFTAVLYSLNAVIIIIIINGNISSSVISRVEAKIVETQQGAPDDGDISLFLTTRCTLYNNNIYNMYYASNC